jgi:hypothetical protein
MELLFLLQKNGNQLKLKLHLLAVLGAVGPIRIVDIHGQWIFGLVSMDPIRPNSER